MDINKALLFFDGTALTASTAAQSKILDLGFSGDFDYKNFEWNRLFIACPANSSLANDLTLAIYTRQTLSYKGTYSSSSTYAVGDVVTYSNTYYTCKTAITSGESWTAAHWDKNINSTALASITIPYGKVKLGAQIALSVPQGIKRYVQVQLTPGATTPSKVTLGFTNDVDTDCQALGGGIDWTNYKATTIGTELTGTPIQNIADVIANGVITTGTVDSAVSAHAALTTGVHGLT